MRRVPDESGNSLVPFVEEVVEKESEILTDRWGGYNELSKHGYQHEKAFLSNTGYPAHINLTGIHRVSALIKGWLLSTQQDSVSGKHLDYYLNEYSIVLIVAHLDRGVCSFIASRNRL